MAFLHKTNPVAISANPATITSSASIPAGSLIILDLTEYYGGSAPQAVASVVDDVNTGAYSIAIAEGASGLVVSAIFYKIADATGTPTVTVTFSGAGTPPGTLSLRVFDGEHTVPGPTSSSYQLSATAHSPGAVNPSGTALYLALYAPHFVYYTVTNTSGWDVRAVRAAVDGSQPIEHYSTDTITSGSQNPVMTLGTAGEVSCVIATFESATDPPQIAAPNADVTDGAWVPSTGSDNYAVIDEKPASDTDYTSTDSNSTLKVGLQPLSNPAAGTQTVRFRANGSPAKKLIVTLIEGASTSRGSLTVDPLPIGFTDYSFNPSGISNYGDLDLEFALSDATSPPANTVTFGAIGTAGTATNTTSHTVNLPSGIQAGDVLYLYATGMSSTAGTNFAITGGGWTPVGTLEGGSGVSYGVDVGNRRVTVFRRGALGSAGETGTVTLTLAGSTTNTIFGSIFNVRAPTGYTISESFASGADTSAGTSYSVTASGSLSWQAGDLLAILVASSTDTATQSAQSITATGVTFGTRTNRRSTACTGGNDHRQILDTVPVNSGSGSSAPVYAYTASASTSGPAAFVRIRAVPPTTFGRVSFAEVEIPASGSNTVTATTSINTAIQASRSATASLNLAIRTANNLSSSINTAIAVHNTATSSIQIALQQAKTATTSLNTAIRQGRTASIVGDLAVQVSRSATHLIDLAVRQGRTSTTAINTTIQRAVNAVASIDTAIQQQLNLSTQISLMIQAVTSASFSINLQIQVPSTLSVAINLAILQAKTATPQIDTAVQTNRTTVASINTAIRTANNLNVAVNTGILVNRNANTSVQTVVQQARYATANLEAAIRSNKTSSTSIEAAIRAARLATVLLDTAIQQRNTSSITVDTAIQRALNALASVDTVIAVSHTLSTQISLLIQAATNASFSINLQVQIPNSISVALNAAILQHKTASIPVDLAIQLAKMAQANIDAAVSQNRTALTSLNIPIQASYTLQTSISTAVQTSRSAQTSINAAIALLRTASVNLNMQIQAGFTQSSLIDLAISQLNAAITSINAAVQVGRQASTVLDLVVALHNQMIFDIDMLIRARKSVLASVNLYVDDGSSIVPSPERTFTAHAGGRITQRDGQGRFVRAAYGRTYIKPSR